MTAGKVVCLTAFRLSVHTQSCFAFQTDTYQLFIEDQNLI